MWPFTIFQVIKTDFLSGKKSFNEWIFFGYTINSIPNVTYLQAWVPIGEGNSGQFSIIPWKFGSEVSHYSSPPPKKNFTSTNVIIGTDYSVHGIGTLGDVCYRPTCVCSNTIACSRVEFRFVARFDYTKLSYSNYCRLRKPIPW